MFLGWNHSYSYSTILAYLPIVKSLASTYTELSPETFLLLLKSLVSTYHELSLETPRGCHSLPSMLPLRQAPPRQCGQL